MKIRLNAKSPALVANAVSYFVRPGSDDPAPRHIQAPNWLHPEDITALQTHLYPAERRY